MRGQVHLVAWLSLWRSMAVPNLLTWLLPASLPALWVCNQQTAVFSVDATPKEELGGDGSSLVCAPGAKCLPAYVCILSAGRAVPDSNQSLQGEPGWRCQTQATAVCTALSRSGLQVASGCCVVCLCRSRLAFSKLVLPADSRAVQMQYQHVAAAGHGGLQVEGLPGQQGLPGEAEAQQMAWEPEPPPTGRRRKQRTTQGALAPLQVGCKLTGLSVSTLGAAQLEPAAAGRQLEPRAAHVPWDPLRCILESCTLPM